jgi:hypothetical protein
MPQLFLTDNQIVIKEKYLVRMTLNWINVERRIEKTGFHKDVFLNSPL